MVQQIATRQLTHLLRLEYQKRCKALGLETLIYQDREMRINIFKIMTEIDRQDINKFVQIFHESRTRGSESKEAKV